MKKTIILCVFILSFISPGLLASSENKPTFYKIIIVGTEVEAKLILTELKDGRPFAVIARERSLDEKSRNRYGDIEKTATGHIDKGLPQIMSRMKEDETSDVIRLKDNRYAIVWAIAMKDYRKGMHAFKLKDFDTAMAKLLSYLELNPNAVKTRITLGSIYERKNEFKKAESMYRDAIAFEPKSLEAYKHLGCLYIKTDRWLEARNLYSQALNHIPDSEILKAALKKTDALADSSRPAKRQNFRNAKTVRLRMIVAASEKDAEDILSELGKGRPFWLLARERSVDEKSKERYGVMGELDTEKLNSALAYLEGGRTSGIIKIDGVRFAIIQSVDISLFEDAEKAFTAGDFKTAEFNLRRYLELNPDALKARILLGSIYEYEKKYDKAEDIYESAISFHPKVKIFYVKLGRMYLSAGRYKAAKEVFEKGLKYHPSSRDLAKGLDLADSFNRKDKM